MAETRSYCGICGWATPHDTNGCVYHQKVIQGVDGGTYRYEEFDQDGN